MKHHPAWERMYLSVLFLAKSKGNLYSRLSGIYQDQLSPLFEKDFVTDEQKESFSSIMNDLNRLVLLSEDEQSDLAGRIVELYNDCLESQYED